MQQLLNIRKTTDIGQPALADFLGMTRQALAKVEKGISALSTANLLKITRLQACLDYATVTAGTEQITPAEKQECTDRETECRYLASILQRKMATYEATFMKAMHLEEALSLFTPADDGEAFWIQKTKIDNNKKLDACGIATWMSLRKRIYLLTAEADYLQRFVNENQSNHENH